MADPCPLTDLDPAMCACPQHRNVTLDTGPAWSVEYRFTARLAGTGACGHPIAAGDRIGVVTSDGRSAYGRSNRDYLCQDCTDASATATR